MRNSYSSNTTTRRFEKAVSVLLVTSIVFVVVFILSFSWFGNQDDAGNVAFIGSVSLSIVSDLDLSGEYLEPNQIYNKTTIISSNADNPDNVDGNLVGNAYVRVKLETTPQINGTENIILPVYNETQWVYDGSEWYYYKGYVNNAVSTTFNTALQVSNNLDNSHQGLSVTITLTVDSIQREYNAYQQDVDWMSNLPNEWETWALTDDWS